jgi:hypothetical protein
MLLTIGQALGALFFFCVSWFVLEDKQKAEQQIILDITEDDDVDERDLEPVFDTSSSR